MRPFGLICLALAMLACGGAEPDDAATPLRVAASIPPHASLVELIGGEEVEVISVLSPGDSPATHQPSDARISQLLGGRVLFRTGVPFESGAWFDAVARNLETVDLRDGVEMRTMNASIEIDHHGHSHPTEGLDPHIWLSPRHLAVQARTVARTLQELDPDRASVYASNLDALLVRIAELDRSIGTALAPHRGRAFVVFHPSWGYFAHDYGLSQIAIETGGKEPSDAELSRLQERIAELGVSVIFVQPQIAGQSARAIAGADGARVVTIDPLAGDVITNLERVTEAIVGSFDG